MRARIGERDRILVVRLSALGDVVHALPALDALRRARPHARIDWCVESASASLLEAHPQLDRVWPIDRKGLVRRARRHPVVAVRELLAFFRPIRAVRYDWAIDLQGNLRSAACALLSGARRRVGFAAPHTAEPAHAVYHRRIRPRTRSRHRVDKSLALLEALGIPTDGARARLGAGDAARARMAPFLATLPHAVPRVALHPGVSAFGAFKRWAPERFAALARALHARQRAHTVITWGPGERSLAERVAAAAGAAAARLAPPTTSLQDLLALFEAMDLVLGCDTGPIHVAAALGVPTLALFGPKDPRVHGPIDARTGRPASTLWRGLDCSPCTLRRCPHAMCMHLIKTEQVARACSRLLHRTATVANRPSAAQAPTPTRRPAKM